jgi:signal transduction histidine kinase
MQDVIMNLLINAIEAVEPNTGQVVVHTESDHESKHIILQVSDNGNGIEKPDEIFKPFYSTKNNVGAGLGLTIAKKIAQLHQGIIEVQSVLGEGSTFIVRIPTKTG